MKLWVDDVRPAPSDEWIVARTNNEALFYLYGHPEYRGKFTTVSLDHDMGGEATTRPLVLMWCAGEHPWPDEVLVHTANPVGHEWLTGMIDRYKA